jgi:hypothetical protein
MASGVTVNIDRAAADRLAFELADRHIRPVANSVLRAARGGVRFKTGAVLSTIRMDYKKTRKVIRYTIGGDHRRTMLEHEGSPPHTITPRRAGGRLVFFWDKAGRVVKLKSVNHPGMEGSKFLTKPLIKFGARAGMRVTLTPRGQ